MNKEKSFCDLCEREIPTRKQQDGLWACVICRFRYYFKED